MEKVLCAAIWYKDLPKPVHGPLNIDRGVVLCGYRHAHVIGQCVSLLGKYQHQLGENVQGFITTKNRFLDRKEALRLHLENGNISYFSDELYSEDLY